MRALLLMLVAALFKVTGSLQNVRLVFPPVVRVGGSATLLCLYDLEGAPLYSVKWYRGNHEFYRFVPREKPPGQAFPFHGINVDLSASNAHQVSLRNVSLHLSGTFSCEVSADAPSFTTKYESNQLTVLEFSESRPLLSVTNTTYLEGDILTINCTTQPSRTPPTLTFYINNRPVPHELVTSWNGGAMLQTQLLQDDFSLWGELRIKCVASVMGLYNISSGSIAIWLHNNAPPMVVRTKSARTGSSSLKQNNVAVLLTTTVLISLLFQYLYFE